MKKIAIAILLSVLTSSAVAKENQVVDGLVEIYIKNAPSGAVLKARSYTLPTALDTIAKYCDLSTLFTHFIPEENYYFWMCHKV